MGGPSAPIDDGIGGESRTLPSDPIINRTALSAAAHRIDEIRAIRSGLFSRDVILPRRVQLLGPAKVLGTRGRTVAGSANVGRPIKQNSQVSGL